MHALKFTPQRNPFSPLCTQCRHAHTTRTQKTRVAIKNTARDLAERAATLRARIRAERTSRREDWFLGPLAPNRAAVNEDYGCLSPREVNVGSRLSLTRQGRSPHMAGEMSWEESLVEVGDRVAVVGEGRERGKVGRVDSVRKGAGECVVKDLNMVDIHVPSFARALDPSQPTIRNVPKPLPLSDVRVIYPLLVAPVYSPNGIITHPSYHQDTVVSKLIRRPDHQNTRFIANSRAAVGRWIEVPPPVLEEKRKAMPKDQEVDTLRFEVEEQTWTPTLLRAPMPAGVVDELRGKYSRFRTRHEPAYQAKLDERKRMREADRIWAKSGGGMLSSPAKEARMMEVDRLKKQGLPNALKVEMLEKIGELMAEKGVEMTESRRMELERNLKGQEVLKDTATVIDTEERVEQASEEDPERREQSQI